MPRDYKKRLNGLIPIEFGLRPFKSIFIDEIIK